MTSRRAAPWRVLRRCILAAALGAAAVAAVPGARAAAVIRSPLPESSLAVYRDGSWRIWWRSDAAPARWTAPLPLLADAVAWRRAAPGVEWGELRLAGTGEAWRLRLVLARIDPRLVRLGLHALVDDDGVARPWSLADAPPEALVALNAGQFGSGGPWGWVVMDGRELRRPGTGPLAPALVADSAGGVRFVAPDDIAAARAAGGIAVAFQSYPTLLAGDGEIPPPLTAPGRGVDVSHRDSRLALGELRDGRLLVALTRFEGLGGALEELPLGPTTPEMAAVMGALGARHAMLLDGGISGQLLVRGAGEWRGLRRVPLGLVVLAR